ncbi:membrane protein [Nocardia neocaledoniensis NBRC 108232]|uniref:Low temperature requirement protein LtrA n=1 Tax=Nocardia neocaledoniensis TaxID=236511 RepID=A0A317N2V2_9NOCA|nr:low temperature requirement protein A [Nocardia neocaledoniensis]PWV68925.1 low temperature requirement protein LtrA [Nocardia neocaledoniensis]GEM29566.1 membrane protein [Nocardia neocaledoniensis NBRC 108232]
MRARHLPLARAVSPLELFFDLVFVLALGQLTHHFVAHMSWRGGAETLVALIAVVGIWTFTTFEITMLDVERKSTRLVTVVVMAFGLFANAGIAHAFDDSPWLFVVPMLAALIGPCVYAALTAPGDALRGHFLRVLLWFAVSTPLWLIGAAAEPRTRLWFWAAAATIDLLGTWFAHPIPGRRIDSRRLEFDAEHMVERMRLFLIIMLGETVLTLGRVITEHHDDALVLTLALGCFVALVCLWQMYFGRAEREVVRHITHTTDPIAAVHLGLSAIYGVVAGLVMFAAGAEMLLGHAHTAPAGIAGALVLTGPAVYLLAQAVYFYRETRSDWLPRVVGAAVLIAAAVVAYRLPPWLVVALLVLILGGLAARLSRASASGTAAPA